LNIMQYQIGYKNGVSVPGKRENLAVAMKAVNNALTDIRELAGPVWRYMLQDFVHGGNKMLGRWPCA